MLHSKSPIITRNAKMKVDSAVKQLNGPIGLEIILQLVKCHLFRGIHNLNLFFSGV